MQQNILFQKYRVIKLLGRGGTAKVYLAEHILLNSYRAIKYISKNNPLYDLQRNEAQILKNLNHPNIPIIYDIEENEKGSYIVEEYLEGENLKKFVEAKGGLREDIIIRFALQLCDLLYYLHNIERPIIYIDLKPENIIVAGNTLKLVDFGSAMYIDQIMDNQDYYGTEGYVAPEAYRRKRINERCDVYGIGMLIYYMVSCRHRDKNLIGSNNYGYKCSKKLQKIIHRCLKYNPYQRYTSVTHLRIKLLAIKKKYRYKYELGRTIRYAVAGAQPRIGTTHLAFRLSVFFIHNGLKCLYQEVNTSGCVRAVINRYGNISCNNEIQIIKGIPMLPYSQYEDIDISKQLIVIKDYGCLDKNNFNEFLNADIKILLLGAKDWELYKSEEILKMIAEDKEVIYVFNYLDSRQFRKVVKNMDKRDCYRLPYEPDPFAKAFDDGSMEFFEDIVYMAAKVKGSD